MLKIALFGMAALFLSMFAGSIRREYGFLVAVCTSFLIFSYGLDKISLMIQEIRAFESMAGIDSAYIRILLKMAGIAYLSQLAVSLCRDAGQGAMAGQIGFAGKISMLIVSLPVLKTLVETIGDILV